MEHIPAVYDEFLAKLLAPALDTSIVDAKVAEFAEDVAQESGSGTFPFLSKLVVRIREHCELIQRETGPAWPASRTLSRCSGSCRDLAVLFMACARHMGIAARFVSGYSIHGEGNAHELHAWSEVYLPGGGWRGYDPSASIAVGTGYIRLAAAAHSSYAAPVIGTYRGTDVGAKVAYDIEIHERENAPA
jgi:transglutaminase-like putative cysteine protease